MNYKAVERHGGNLNSITKWKKPIWKATYCVIPTTLHSGKGKTMNTVKNQGLPEVRGKGGWLDRAQKILKAMRLLHMILFGEYMWLYLCQNS